MARRFVVILTALIALCGLTIFSVTQLQGKSQPAYSADVIAALSDNDTSGYARALAFRDFSFPRDFGVHPDFQTEWWYYTGNLATQDGRRFGYEFTIFRRAMTPTLPQRQSEWATNQIYFADLAISDIGANQFYSKQQFSRGAVGLAGAAFDPRLHVWIQDWSMTTLDDSAATLHLQATEDPVALDLTTHQIKPPTLEGNHGLSQKSEEQGNASYYYSLTRLPTDGQITVNGTVYKVNGNTWMDHEFSTSSLSKDAVGWDWLSLQLDDQREIMLYRIRNKDGSDEAVSDGTLVEANGESTHLTLKDFKIEPLAQWTSPHSGSVYPSRWRVTVQAPSGPIQLEITPLMADQELNGVTRYWEGASQISGTHNGQPVKGYGYVELTGYSSCTAQANCAQLER